MPLFGSHLSVAGGLYKAVDAAAELGMSTVQIFTHSPSQWSVKAVATDAAGSNSASRWQAKLLGDDDIRRFREAIARTGITRPCAHDSYLINLGSPDDELWQRSLEAIVAELERAESLDLVGLVMHPGSFVSSTEAEGQARIVKGLNEAHRRTKGFRCQYWLETTAGQGTNLGYRFEQIAFVLNEVKAPERLGVCVDSCHIFAGGYPLQAKADYDATMDEFEELIGVDKIRAWHLNDSKKPLGSRVDRHHHIGEGCLGVEPFRHIVNDPRFADTPMYLETEKGMRDGVNLDAMNLATLRGLIADSPKKKSRTKRPAKAQK